MLWNFFFGNGRIHKRGCGVISLIIIFLSLAAVVFFAGYEVGCLHERKHAFIALRKQFTMLERLRAHVQDKDEYT
jgi:hypothetical protein